jgi:hypothetical protein
VEESTCVKSLHTRLTNRLGCSCKTGLGGWIARASQIDIPDTVVILDLRITLFRLKLDDQLILRIAVVPEEGLLGLDVCALTDDRLG